MIFAASYAPCLAAQAWLRQKYSAFCPAGETLFTKIYNGVSCDATSSPVIKLVIRFSTGHSGLCSGTLIDSKHILSAAHCFAPLPGKRVINSSAWVGGHELAFHKVRYPKGIKIVSLRYPNGMARTQFNYDLAVVELSTAVQNISPAILSAGHPLKAGHRVGILGFGLDQNQNAGELKLGETLIMKVEPNFIFADFTKKQLNDTCIYDSGGPLVSGAGVAGLTSDGTGSGCGAPEISSYTNLANGHMRRFIKSVAPGAVFR